MMWFLLGFGAGVLTLSVVIVVSVVRWAERINW